MFLSRGIAESCGRDEATPAAGIPHTPTRHATDEQDRTANNETVRLLLERLSDLEAKLRENERSRASHVPVAVASVEPVESAPVAPTQPASSLVAEDDAAQHVHTSGIGADDLDAATVLEFLAWGRKKNSDFNRAPEHDSGPRQPIQNSINPSMTNPLAENSTSAHLDMLEALMPSKSHIAKLVNFHNSSVLWYHGSYCASVFSADLDTFFHEHGANIRHEQLNLQWLALLFAVLTGSMTCASPAVVQSWGFSAAEQPVLSSRWYGATVTCLNLAGYMELHTVYSVQSIATLTISAHILGNSNSQSVLLASAGRIAQSLGLHRLENESGSAAETTVDQVRKSEAGKRLFIQLCTQDWFSIPFSETYALTPRFISDTIRPLNCNDDDMVVQPESVPTQASYCNYRFDIASLMPQLLDAMSGCNTAYTRYEQVLKFDDKMRKLVTASMPTFLANQVPVADEWPAYVGWARRSLAICACKSKLMRTEASKADQVHST